jgi:hypothetical protein
MLSNQNATNDLDAALIGNSCSPTCAMVRVPSPSADLRSARLPTTFRRKSGHPFQFEVGHRSDLKPATPCALGGAGFPIGAGMVASACGSASTSHLLSSVFERWR